jgi:hypothetical protein
VEPVFCENAATNQRARANGRFREAALRSNVELVARFDFDSVFLTKHSTTVASIDQ